MTRILSTGKKNSREKKKKTELLRNDTRATNACTSHVHTIGLHSPKSVGMSGISSFAPLSISSIATLQVRCAEEMLKRPMVGGGHHQKENATEQWPVKSFMGSDPSRGGIGEIPTIRYDQDGIDSGASHLSPSPSWYFSYFVCVCTVHTSSVVSAPSGRSSPLDSLPWRASPCV
jgi:hypothetical protein